jgi:hypothetical protein
MAAANDAARDVETIKVKTLIERQILPNKTLIVRAAFHLEAQFDLDSTLLDLEAEPGTQIKCFHNERCTYEERAPYKKYMITIGAMKAGTTRTILMTLSLRAMRHTNGQLMELLRQKLLSSSIYFTDTRTGVEYVKNDSDMDLSIQRPLPSATPSLPRNAELGYYINRQLTANALSGAMKAVEKSNHSSARFDLMAHVDILSIPENAEDSRTQGLIDVCRSALHILSPDLQSQCFDYLDRSSRALYDEDETSLLLKTS